MKEKLLGVLEVRLVDGDCDRVVGLLWIALRRDFMLYAMLLKHSDELLELVLGVECPKGPQIFPPFRFRTLVITCFAVGISSGLLSAMKRVMARVSPSMTASPEGAWRLPFLPRKQRNHTAAILAFRSAKEWFFAVKYSRIAAFSSRPPMPSWIRLAELSKPESLSKPKISAGKALPSRQSALRRDCWGHHTTALALTSSHANLPGRR